MSQTKAEVRDRAANDLGILRLGQSLQAQDVTRIERGYTEVYADLQKEGLATWASTGSVPDELVPHVAALVALNCTETYGVSPARFARIAAKTVIALPEIRRLTTPDHESLDEPNDY